MFQRQSYIVSRPVLLLGIGCALSCAEGSTATGEEVVFPDQLPQNSATAPGGGAGPASPGSAGASPQTPTAPGSTQGPTTPAATTPAPPIDPVPGGYFTEGNQIFKSDGTPHVFRGFARPSLEWDRNGQGLNSGDDFNKMKEWGANVTRLALNQRFWLEGGAYPNKVDQVVSWAKQAGLDVILDLHWSDRNGAALGDGGQQPMADRRSITFWSQVAAKYKDDPKVLFELYNEPISVSCRQWLTGAKIFDMEGEYEGAGMQEMYDAVRAAGAPNLVLVGGYNWAYDLSCVKDNAVYGSNIVYVTHIYDYERKQPDDWARAWGFVTENYPVMITEFGYDQEPPNCSRLNEFGERVLDAADAQGLGWIAWAWFPSDCSFPALLAPNGSVEQSLSQAQPSEFGNLIKTRLQSY